MKMFVTGATGNAGRAVISSGKKKNIQIYAGLRDVDRIRKDDFFMGVVPVSFDFENIDNSEIPSDIDAVFLMRPPKITDPHLFSSFLQKLKGSKPHIIFLSIQGADKKEFTPHRKIEHQIIESGLNYTFIRPGYFMENLLTTLYEEIRVNRRIYLPSGRMKLNWISVEDIGELICTVALNPDQYSRMALEVTGRENLDFSEVCSIVNEVCGTDITYQSPNVIIYVLHMLSKKSPPGFIAVMLLLHWLPKFGREPEITETFKNTVGRDPAKMREFVLVNKTRFL